MLGIKVLHYEFLNSLLYVFLGAVLPGPDYAHHLLVGKRGLMRICIDQQHAIWNQV
jgi:hypothetical protein